MKTILKTAVVTLSFLFASLTFGQNNVKPNDLNILLGDWKGNLTYIDYGTQKPYSMPANLTVKNGKTKYQLLLSINYPNEPNANSKDKIKISKNGKKINKVNVTSVERLTNKPIKIIAEYLDKDNNKKAQIRNVYLISKNELIIRKEVKFEDSKDWMMRNEYRYTK